MNKTKVLSLTVTGLTLLGMLLNSKLQKMEMDQLKLELRDEITNQLKNDLDGGK